MKRNRFKRFFTLLLAVLLLAGTATTARAETAAERYSRLKDELAAIDEQIDGYQNEKADAEKMRVALVDQQNALHEMIELNKQQIAESEAALAGKQQEVADKRAVIYENEQLFCQRLRAIYKMNNSSELSTLLNVDTFSELITVLDTLQRVSVHDTDLIQLLNDQRAELETQEAEIDTMLESLRATYEELDRNAAALAQNITAQDARISAAAAQIAANEQAYDETHEALEQAQAEMIAIANQVNNTGSSSGDGSEYTGGAFTWPVPGHYRITCYFGSPDPNGRAHRGMDIGAPTGAGIVAAAEGTVIISTFAGSYGNYIVVDHGGGLKTLYAHCSALYVGVGTYVTKGQSIAAVGTTGFVTGAHLHFEVQTSGGLQNPLAYLQ